MRPRVSSQRIEEPRSLSIKPTRLLHGLSNQPQQPPFPLNCILLQSVSSGFVRQSGQCSAAPFPLRCWTLGAEGTNTLQCKWPLGLLYSFPSIPLIPRVVRKLLEEKADVILIAPYLVPASLVCGSQRTINRPPMEKSAGSDLPSTRGCLSSGSPMIPVSRLVLEREILKRGHYLAKVIATLLASHRRSTTRIYDATWSFLHCWCVSLRIDPTCASIPQVLDFLQVGLNAGLAVNTLKRQVVALGTVLSCKDHGSLS